MFLQYIKNKSVEAIKIFIASKFILSKSHLTYYSEVLDCLLFLRKKKTIHSNTQQPFEI